MNVFVINRKLPGLNEYTSACRSSPYIGAKFKQELETDIGWAIKLARSEKTLHPIEKPVVVRIDWHEKTRKRDVDNIVYAKKFILDALVSSGILVDDGRKYVRQIYDTVIDDKSDFVVVRLEEI